MDVSSVPAMGGGTLVQTAGFSVLVALQDNNSLESEQQQEQNQPQLLAYDQDQRLWPCWTGIITTSLQK